MSTNMPTQNEFYININGQRVLVKKEIYLMYYRSKRRDRYYERDIKTESAVRDAAGNINRYKPAKEDSLERLMEFGEDYADKEENVEETVFRIIMTDKLHKALDDLPKKERVLIEALFFSNNGKE